MDTWKISKNSDSATQDALSNFLVEVNMTLPTVKTNFFETYGLNGSIDETEALGGVNYSDREVTLFLVTKSGISNPKLAVDTFINTYVGGKIRLHNTTHSYMLIGRITDVRQIKTKVADEYKLVCTVICEPLRYDTTYTPSASGLDITPENLGANLWSAENVTPLDTGMTVTASGGTIAANAPITSGEGHMFDVDTAVIGSGKLLRFYFSSLVNCKIELRNRGKVIGEGKGTILVFTDDGQCSINVFRKDKTAEASFACTIREITTHTVNNAGKAVPFAVNHYYSASIDYIPKMYVNGTVFSLGGLASESIWDEYAPAVLRSGNNVVAAFIDYGNFDASGANGTIKIRYRKGVL